MGAVRDFLEPAIGHVSQNEYYAVGEDAIRLPGRPFTISQILDSHLRWSWAIALGYGLAVWVHLLING